MKPYTPIHVASGQEHLHVYAKNNQFFSISNAGRPSTVCSALPWRLTIVSMSEIPWRMYSSLARSLRSNINRFRQNVFFPDRPQSVDVRQVDRNSQCRF